MTSDYLETKWKQSGVTVAGGNQLNQLEGPHGIFMDDDQSIYIADFENSRIIVWKLNATSGQIIVGENGQGTQLDQLDRPTDVIIDRQTDSLIIADWGNRRVVRYGLVEIKQM